MSTKLDEILREAQSFIDDDRLKLEARKDAKQAILQWVNDEVIGKDEESVIGPGVPGYQRNRVKQEQREILKQHGWKG